MAATATQLRRQLIQAGLSKSAIDAAWPDWWTDSAEDSASARAELRFALARRLGLSPRALLGERVEFTWPHDARFKHLSAQTEAQQALLASFGTALGRLLVRAAPAGPGRLDESGLSLRAAILRSNPFVTLESLVALCWALGIPVIQLRIFPMTAKSMHAMVTSFEDRHAILLAFDAHYPSRSAFTLAHELGHIALGHVGGSGALVDLDDVGAAEGGDAQEEDADRFALELLTGSARPEITTSLESYTARSLAAAVVEASARERVEPGTLALCLGKQSGQWGKAMRALHYVYGQQFEIWRYLNSVADTQLDWDQLSGESSDYLRRLMGAGD